LIAKKVIELVIDIRRLMPKLGGRKLYYLLQDKLRTIKIGRDKLFTILRANHMLIKPQRRYHVTTNSLHRFRKHRNLVSNKEINKPETVWVSDITYVGTRMNPSYLSLVTDAYSKKIMGYNVSQSLAVEGSLSALKMAFNNREYLDRNEPLIHHSDRGLQYCSNEYQELITKNKVKASMTEKYDPYENAIAERVNGILKQEFNIARNLKSIELKKELIKNAINIYNTKRPHFSNHMLTLLKMHKQNTLQRKVYKSKKVEQ
jgi:transposase InsO family protein